MTLSLTNMWIEKRLTIFMMWVLQYCKMKLAKINRKKKSKIELIKNPSKFKSLVFTIIIIIFPYQLSLIFISLKKVKLNIIVINLFLIQINVFWFFILLLKYQMT